MRLQQYNCTPEGKPRSYTMWLSANDTYNWAHRPGAAWPCSTTSGHKLRVSVDSNGLYDFTIDGKYLNEWEDIDGNELDAIVSDHLPEHLRHLWPTWGK